MAKIAKRSELLAETEKLAQAYKLVFDPKSPVVGLVLADLVRFCRARDSEFHGDARLHAFLSGRRDVWLRIEQYTMDSAETILNRNSRPLEIAPESINKESKE